MGFIGSKTDAKYLGVLLLLTGLVLWDLVILRSAFLSGDHLVQHYPFAQFLQNEIRSFRFPWWTSLIHSGFPVLAEGQIGAFYPPNLLFLFFLPLRWAYNYEVLFHYTVATLFFYAYLRSLRLSSFSAFLSTLTFLFGSANAGFFYNITSQRVMVWFPLALILTDRIITQRCWRSALGLGTTFALQVVAGYQQLAIYSIGFAILYYLLQARLDQWRSSFPLILLALILGAAMSAVQWVPMLRLSLYSARASAVEALAYEGSASPLVGMTLLYPAWTGFLRGGFYVGMLGLFFAFVSLWRKKEPVERTWWILFAVSILLALGRFSPFYLLIVRAFKIYFFRVPAKFLFFSAFALSVVSAFGIEHAWVRRGEQTPAQRAAISMGLLFLAVTAGIGVGHWVLLHYRDPLSAQIETYVHEKIYGKPFHPLSMEIYRQKIDAYFRFFLRLSSTRRREVWMPVLLFGLQSGIWTLLFRGKRGTKASFALAAVLVFDLCYYTTRDIRTDLYPYSLVEIKSRLVQRLREDKSVFRTHVLNFEPWKSGNFPYLANQNMLWGIAETGIYSPLAMRKYKDYLEDWGGVDDSLFARPARKETLEKNKSILDQLNVKYLFTREELNASGWKPVDQEGDVRLYQNESVLPRFFHVARIDTLFSASDIHPIEVLKMSEGEYVFNTRSLNGDYVVVSEQNYPGWKAHVSGQTLEPIPLGPCLKAFPIPGGSDQMIVGYTEKNKGLLYLVSGGSFLVTLVLLILFQLCGGQCRGAFADVKG